MAISIKALAIGLIIGLVIGGTTIFLVEPKEIERVTETVLGPTVTERETISDPTETVTVTVIEGTFDVTADGDLISVHLGDELHWKNISVPQLTLSDMPLVKVYLKPYGWMAEGWPNDSQIDAGADFIRLPKNAIAYDEYCVLILYKIATTRQTDIFITGEYKIVVVK